uniref:Lin-66-like winged helix domain-containing protein n=1 Tax=Caenorhabditis tropicalis TaxID=1561998 RepID=A0A1I7T1I7_9PELO
MPRRLKNSKSSNGRNSMRPEWDDEEFTYPIGESSRPAYDPTQQFNQQFAQLSVEYNPPVKSSKRETPPDYINGFGTIVSVFANSATIIDEDWRIDFTPEDFCEETVTNIEKVLRVGMKVKYDGHLEEVRDDYDQFKAQCVVTLDIEDYRHVFSEMKEVELSMYSAPGYRLKENYSKDLEMKAYEAITNVFRELENDKMEWDTFQMAVGKEQLQNDELFKYIGDSEKKRRMFLETRNHLFYVEKNKIFLKNPLAFQIVSDLCTFILCRGGIFFTDKLYEYYSSDEFNIVLGSNPFDFEEFVKFLSSHPFVFAVFPDEALVSARRNLPDFDYFGFIKSNFPTILGSSGKPIGSRTSSSPKGISKLFWSEEELSEAERAELELYNSKFRAPSPRKTSPSKASSSRSFMDSTGFPEPGPSRTSEVSGKGQRRQFGSGWMKSSTPVPKTNSKDQTAEIQKFNEQYQMKINRFLTTRGKPSNQFGSSFMDAPKRKQEEHGSSETKKGRPEVSDKKQNVRSRDTRKRYQKPARKTEADSRIETIDNRPSELAPDTKQEEPKTSMLSGLEFIKMKKAELDEFLNNLTTSQSFGNLKDWNLREGLESTSVPTVTGRESKSEMVAQLKVQQQESGSKDKELRDFWDAYWTSSDLVNENRPRNPEPVSSTASTVTSRSASSIETLFKKYEQGGADMDTDLFLEMMRLKYPDAYRSVMQEKYDSGYQSRDPLRDDVMKLPKAPELLSDKAFNEELKRIKNQRDLDSPLSMTSLENEYASNFDLSSGIVARVVNLSSDLPETDSDDEFFKRMDRLKESQLKKDSRLEYRDSIQSAIDHISKRISKLQDSLNEVSNDLIEFKKLLRKLCRANNH